MSCRQHELGLLSSGALRRCHARSCLCHLGEGTRGCCRGIWGSCGVSRLWGGAGRGWEGEFFTQGEREQGGMPEPPRCGSSLASLAGWELTGWGEARGVGENILESFPRCCSSSAAPEEKIPSPALGAAGFPVAPPESRDKGGNFLSFAFSWLFFFNPSLKEFLNSHWGDESRMSPPACALFGVF